MRILSEEQRDYYKRRFIRPLTLDFIKYRFTSDFVERTSSGLLTIFGYSLDNLKGYLIAIMAAFLDDRPLVAGVNENLDDINTYQQVTHPDWDISPIQMKTKHHLPQTFFDTLRPERPDCPVLIPSNFSMARDRLIAQDLYSYTMCGLQTGDFMPAEQAQNLICAADPPHDCQPGNASRPNTRSRSSHARARILSRPELLQTDFVSYSIPGTRTRCNLAGIQGRAG